MSNEAIDVLSPHEEGDTEKYSLALAQRVIDLFTEMRGYAPRSIAEIEAWAAEQNDTGHVGAPSIDS